MSFPQVIKTIMTLGTVLNESIAQDLTVRSITKQYSDAFICVFLPNNLNRLIISNDDKCDYSTHTCRGGQLS